jgi:hypothetical protein
LCYHAYENKLISHQICPILYWQFKFISFWVCSTTFCMKKLSCTLNFTISTLYIGRFKTNNLGKQWQPYFELMRKSLIVRYAFFIKKALLLNFLAKKVDYITIRNYYFLQWMSRTLINFFIARYLIRNDNLKTLTLYYTIWQWHSALALAMTMPFMRATKCF